jgi:hypothetical protein
LVSATSTDPGAPGGLAQTSSVSETSATLAAATPPNVTWFSPAWNAEKPLPDSVTLVPPISGPSAGAIESSVGLGARKR